MTLLQWISILFIVIAQSFTSIATLHDENDSQNVIATYEKAIVSSSWKNLLVRHQKKITINLQCKVNNELNTIIINKLMTILTLETLEKKRFSEVVSHSNIHSTYFKLKFRAFAQKVFLTVKSHEVVLK